MLNRTLVAFSLLIFVAGLSSCSLYPENPLITLGSKEARVANTWKVAYAADEDGEDVTDSQDGTKYTFGESGDAELDSKVVGANFTATGTWELTDEGAALKIDLEYSILGVVISLPFEYDILKLTEDELWLQDQDDSDVVIHLEPF